MAEVLGTVASITQLIDFSGTLLAGGYTFIAKVVRAPSEIRSLLTEVAAVNGLLGQLDLLADSAPKSSPADALQAQKHLGVRQECQNTLKYIQDALARCEQESGKGTKNFGRKLKWPFKEKETKDALQRLHNLRSVLANAIEVDSANSLRRLEASQDVLVDGMLRLTTGMQTQMSREEAQKVVSWLCPLPSSGAYVSLQNALGRRLPGTGNWFIESNVFKDWMASRHRTIWITGLPGSGKTVLCASAIREILANSTDNTAVLYFFFDHRDPSKSTHENLVMTFARQMLESNRPSICMNYAKKLYDEKANNGVRAFNHDDYVPLIESFMMLFDSIFILCDALDESSDADDIASTLERLHFNNVPTRLLFTSRFDLQLEHRHEAITRRRVALAENMQPDIEQYVKTEVESSVAKRLLKLRDTTLRESIEGQVTKQAGTMLQARLQLDYIKSAKNDRDLKIMIKGLPDGLESTYETLLRHTASQYPEQITDMKTLLRCLVIASPTLTAASLAEILAMQPGQPYLDFDAVATDPYDILDIIAPFVVLTDQEKVQSVVKLSHYSLDEYLLSDRILQSQASEFHIDYAEGNAWLACVCLQYLTFDVFDCLTYGIPRPGISLSLSQDYAFRRYATLNWFRHYGRARTVSTFRNRCEPYLRRLLGSYCYKQWQEEYAREYPYDEIYQYSPIGFTISQGMDEIVDDMLAPLADINASIGGPDGFTCLTLAAKWNRASIVRKLLDLGSRLEVVNAKGRTALHAACEFASREAFDILLEAGANVHARSSSGSTPFYLACRGGDTAIVKRLRDCGCDINSRTHDSWTPIMEAVENGHDDVIDLLLEWGADLTITTKQRWTVFLIAEDGFNLAPSKSISEKLANAAPRNF